MKLKLEGLKDAGWEKAGVTLPAYDIKKMAEATVKEPVWVHFGAGNIFRGYIANLQNRLLNAGLAEKGIIAVDSSDGDQITKVYRPFDNLTLLVSLYADGSARKEVIASVAEAVHADGANSPATARLREIFSCPALQLCSFTVTEKGYAVKNPEAETPDAPVSVAGKVTALLYERFKAGRFPIALVSMDNCSHNGEILKRAVLSVARSWVLRDLAEKAFEDWLEDETCVSFPWTMIDKITPRPDGGVAQQLKALGIEDMDIIPRARGAAVAPFVNCEAPEYLVIEDRFPNGRPALEKAGVYMADRDTVNKTERMKVTTCLNPLHTALAVLGCMLGYDRIYREMQDPDLKALAERIGRVEGMPVVTDPGIINPEEFLNEVLYQRLPNPYIPDMPQRIACDTSHKIPVRFGETIKAYLASDTLDAGTLRAIPFVIAAWLRYLDGTDDEGQPFTLSDDPRIPELQEKLQSGIDEILADETIFGADLTGTPLRGVICGYYESLKQGPGAVRRTLHEVVSG